MTLLSNCAMINKNIAKNNKCVIFAIWVFQTICDKQIFNINGTKTFFKYNLNMLIDKTTMLSKGHGTPLAIDRVFLFFN